MTDTETLIYQSLLDEHHGNIRAAFIDLVGRYALCEVENDHLRHKLKDSVSRGYTRTNFDFDKYVKAFPIKLDATPPIASNADLHLDTDGVPANG